MKALLIMLPANDYLLNFRCACPDEKRSDGTLGRTFQHMVILLSMKNN